MKFVIALAFVFAAWCGITSEANAQYSARDLEYYCNMGSQTPASVRPYCRGRGGALTGYRPRRQLSQEEIDYYCSQGSQTPASVRPYCGGGYRGGYQRDDDDDYYYQGRRLSQREIQYYCSMGSQTPLSLRRYCGRY
ncbi:hypothetical protein [Rhodoplanes sp. Z2-YC6860]|uniref:hypothetical protein n=1 Tax=Rhodoplanes sp. Z2-YC6860 TaxID=674703 RepID=UPI0012EE41F4|nr:hypothetical protein [Rhodoplanes sp. Z2-YC6860]